MVERLLYIAGASTPLRCCPVCAGENVSNSSRLRPSPHTAPGSAPGRRRDEIPEAARQAAVADAHDALFSLRVSKPDFTYSAAVGTIEAGRVTRYDPEFVDASLANAEGFRRLMKGTWITAAACGRAAKRMGPARRRRTRLAEGGAQKMRPRGRGIDAARRKADRLEGANGRGPDFRYTRGLPKYIEEADGSRMRTFQGGAARHYDTHERIGRRAKAG
jgi:hypothetical protein